MSSWSFCNIGFSCEKKSVKDVKKLLECMNIDFENAHESVDGEINDMFWNIDDKGEYKFDFEVEEIYFIVNKIYNNTIIYYEGEEGSSICDWYSRSEKIFDPKTNKIYLGKYDYCIGDGEDKEISEWIEDIPTVDLKAESIEKIIKNAEIKKYNDLIIKIKEAFSM